MKEENGPKRERVHAHVFPMRSRHFLEHIR